MSFYMQMLSIVTAGIILLWFGYSLFFGGLPLLGRWNIPWHLFKRKPPPKGEIGEPMVCPLCSMRLYKGDLVKTLAFPSINGGIDRLMYIRGCYSCLNNDLPRRCPVCGTSLSVHDYLVSRMFERRFSKNHVHIIGCNHCKRTGSLDR